MYGKKHRNHYFQLRLKLYHAKSFVVIESKQLQMVYCIFSFDEKNNSIIFAGQASKAKSEEKCCTRTLLYGQGVFLDFGQNHRCTDKVLTKRRGFPSPYLPNNILKSGVIQQQLRQYLLENFHTIPEIGKV